MRLARRRHVHFGTAVAHGTDGIHHATHFNAVLLKAERRVVFGPFGDHDGIALMRQRLPDFFRDKRHERMQELQCIGHDPHQHLAGTLRGLLVLALHADFGDLDIPVAEIIPQKVIELLHGDAKLEFLKILGDLLCHLVEGADDPAVGLRQVLRQAVFHLMAFNIHADKAGRVPDFIRKVTAGADLVV